jgi:general L-amino acid transport system permease protein
VRVYLKERQGHPPTGQFWWATVGLVALLGIGWLVVPGAPLRITIPTLTGSAKIVNYEGGWVLSNNFQAVLLGLVLYTAAFIAEVVRAGIQAVPFGQIEAATALGLPHGLQLRLIILPQAMRVIIPPLINQYLNLVKNSSLAIAVAFPDLFNISQTIGNQTGQNTQVIIMVMAAYLSISLTISLLLNIINKRMQIVER